MGSLFPKKRSHHTAKHSNHKIHWWPNMKKKDVVITPAKSEKPENHANFQKESFGAGFSILNFGSVTLLKMSHWIKKFPGYDNSPPTPTEFHVSSALAETNKLPTRKKKTKTPRNWVLFFDQILIEMLVLKKQKYTHTWTEQFQPRKKFPPNRNLSQCEKRKNDIETPMWEFLRSLKKRNPIERSLKRSKRVSSPSLGGPGKNHLQLTNETMLKQTTVKHMDWCHKNLCDEFEL